MNVVTITESPLSLPELRDVAGGAHVELAADAQARIRASRAVVDSALAGDRPVYGLNTGVGHMKDVRLGDDELHRQQEVLLRTHAGGLGPPLPTELVRAAIAVRLVGIARGGSGASPAAAGVLAAMLNSGVHPVVPGTGSVGAGDLGQMATIALVAIGGGLAEHHGEVLAGAEALRRAGIDPLVLAPKDGLALMSANGISIGHGALVVSRAATAAAAADEVTALSMEATGANPSIVLPVVGRAKPFPGQIQACAHLRALLAGSYLLDPDTEHSVQDALSFRVAPQVHGALREFTAFARRAVEIELNAAGDNPLVSLEDQTLVSNGNFHPVVLAVAFDALRVAIAHVGQLSERRMSHLWDAFFQGLASRGAPPPDGDVPELPGMSLRYAAAAVYAELEHLATPATLAGPPLDLGVEDHSTGAPLSVRKTETALGLLEDILAIELLLARDVLGTMSSRPVSGTGGTRALQTVAEALTATVDRSPAAVHEALRTRFPSALTSALADGTAQDCRPR